MAERWARFVRAAAERYDAAPQGVAAWEIGNEVDGKTVVTDVDDKRPPEGQGEADAAADRLPGDRPAAYLAFSLPAYAAIKAVDPEVPAIVGCSATWRTPRRTSSTATS
ncbi:MAG: hypothetical protein U0470_01830 [Anaerolineae bacterium]